MADNFYSGSMAPPLRLPNGTLVPAPAVQPQESVDQMYQGIYPQSDTIGRVETVNPDGSPQNPGIARVTPEGLDVRNVRTVSIDPVTGNPVSPQVQTVVDAMQQGSPYDAAYEPGIPTSSAYRGGWGSDAFPSIVASGIPHAGGTEIDNKDQARLAASDGQLFAYGDGIPNSGNPGIAAITRALAAQAGLGVAGPAAGDFLSGDPGVTDWTVANQGGGGILGPNNAPSSLPANAPPGGRYGAGGYLPNGLPSSGTHGQIVQGPDGKYYQYVQMTGGNYGTGNAKWDWEGVAAPASAVPAQVSAVHAALMAKQQLQSPGAQAALAKGQGAYVVSGGNSGSDKRGRNGNALGENALMPTRAMDGSIRNSYGDF